MKSALRCFAAALLPLCVLLWLPMMPSLILMFGQEVRLAARPTDPRDPFRGDYVALEFDIEGVANAFFSGDVEYGAECFITLSPDVSGLWGPVAVSRAEPEEGVCLRGWVSVPRISDAEYRRVDFGPELSRFYVPEGTGLALERAAREGRGYAATVRILRGRPAIVSLDVAQ